MHNLLKKVLKNKKKLLHTDIKYIYKKRYLHYIKGLYYNEMYIKSYLMYKKI